MESDDKHIENNRSSDMMSSEEAVEHLLSSPKIEVNDVIEHFCNEESVRYFDLCLCSLANAGDYNSALHLARSWVRKKKCTRSIACLCYHALIIKIESASICTAHTICKQDAFLKSLNDAMLLASREGNAMLLSLLKLSQALYHSVHCHDVAGALTMISNYAAETVPSMRSLYFGVLCNLVSVTKDWHNLGKMLLVDDDYICDSAYSVCLSLSLYVTMKHEIMSADLLERVCSLIDKLERIGLSVIHCQRQREDIRRDSELLALIGVIGAETSICEIVPGSSNIVQWLLFITTCLLQCNYFQYADRSLSIVAKMFEASPPKAKNTSLFKANYTVIHARSQLAQGKLNRVEYRQRCLLAHEIEPSDSECCCELGNTFLEEQDLLNARHYFELAITLHAANHRAWYGLAHVHQSEGRWSVAMECGMTATRIQSRCPLLPWRLFYTDMLSQIQ